jgi:hypothetical protein
LHFQIVRIVFRIPPGLTVFHELPREIAAIGQSDFGHGAAVAIRIVLDDSDGLAVDQIVRKPGGVLAASLTAFRAVDAEQADFLDMTGRFNDERVAIDDANYAGAEGVAREGGGGREEEQEGGNEVAHAPVMARLSPQPGC